MSFLKVGGKPPKKKQRLYLMRITMPSGIVLHKFGKASGNSSKERMLSICGSIFDKFRSTPMVKIVRDREVPADLVFKYESALHRFFMNYRYETKHAWDGVTECFVLPEDSEDAIQAYEAVIGGLEPDKIYMIPDAEEDKLPF